MLLDKTMSGRWSELLKTKPDLSFSAMVDQENKLLIDD